MFVASWILFIKYFNVIVILFLLFLLSHEIIRFAAVKVAPNTNVLSHILIHRYTQSLNVMQDRPVSACVLAVAKWLN